MYSSFALVRVCKNKFLHMFVDEILTNALVYSISRLKKMEVASTAAA